MRALATGLMWLAMAGGAGAQAYPAVSAAQGAREWSIQADDGGEGLQTELRRAELSEAQREIAATHGSAEGSTAGDEAFWDGMVAEGGRAIRPRWTGKASGPSNPVPLAYFGTLLLGCAGLCVWQAARVERRRAEDVCEEA